VSYQTWLLDAFVAEGIEVIEEPGWETRGKEDWDGLGGEPDGGVTHHTAPPVPYPVRKMYPEPEGLDPNGRIRCNWNIKQDGKLHLIAAGACNYASGPGTGSVLADVRQEIAPRDTAYNLGLRDDLGTNGYYLQVEVDHLGDLSQLPVAAFDTTVRAWVAVCRYKGWHQNRIIGHGESTKRKIDPYWNGKNAHENLVVIRNFIKTGLEDNMWNEPGDKILTVEDARRVIFYQGSMRPESLPEEMLIPMAMVLDLDMQHDIRIRKLEKGQ